MKLVDLKALKHFYDNYTIKEIQVNSSKINPTSGVVNITKSALGLGNVDNTADANKSVNYATTAGSAYFATQTTVDSSLSSTSEHPLQNKVINSALGNKVDKVSGKGLSTNDYTTTEKNKLAGIASGAEVNVQSDWNVTSTTSDAFIKNKPTSLPANGGNADTVDNKHASDFLMNTRTITNINQATENGIYKIEATSTNTGMPYATCWFILSVGDSNKSLTAYDMLNKDNVFSNRLSNGSLQGNWITVLPRRCCTAQESGGTSKPYYKFASTRIAATITDHFISFYVSSGNGTMDKRGILTAHAKMGSTLGVIESIHLTWDYAGKDIDPNDFYICYKNNNGSYADVELWVRIPTERFGYHFMVLGQYYYNDFNDNMWTLHNLKSAGSQTTLPSGYTCIQSKIMEYDRYVFNNEVDIYDRLVTTGTNQFESDLYVGYEKYNGSLRPTISGGHLYVSGPLTTESEATIGGSLSAGNINVSDINCSAVTASTQSYFNGTLNANSDVNVGGSITITGTARTKNDLVTHSVKPEANNTYSLGNSSKYYKNAYINNINDVPWTKVITQDNIPTSFPASDVYAWAKAATKPTYTKAEVGLGNVGNFKAVSTVANQGLTDTEKANARTNINAGTSSFSGNYNDLTNKPTIPAAVAVKGNAESSYRTGNVNITAANIGLGNVGNFKAVSTVANQSLSADEKTNARANIGAGTSSFSGNYNDLTNKPTLFSGNYNDLTNKPTIPAAVAVKGNSETNYRTGNVNITAANIGLGNVGNFKAVSTVASQGLTDTEKANARTNIGAGTSSFSGSYSDLSNKPTIPAAVAVKGSAESSYRTGNVNITKANIGLGNVDNTADANKSVSYAATAGSADFATQTTVDDSLSATSENPLQNKVINSALGNKVDKVSGKGLSANDYTTTEKNKLAGIASGAEVNVQSDWNVTTTTSDAFIKNKPTSLPASDVYSWAKASAKPTYTKSEVGLGNVGNFKAVSTVANQGLSDTEKSNARTNIGAGTSSFSGSYNDLSNKPTLFSGNYNDLTNKPTIPAAVAVKGNSETNYRTGNVNITAANIGLGSVGNFKAVSTVANQGLSATEKTNARANIGAGTSSFSGSYTDLSNKPTLFSGSYTDLTNKPTIPAAVAVKGNAESSYRTGNVNITPTNIGLGNVGNFKAVSTVANQGLSATEKTNARANIGAGTSSFSGSYSDLTNKPTIPAAVAVKGNAESSYRTGNVNITAANIGLGNVGNFKAVSTVASQSLTDTEKANARTNIEAAPYQKFYGENFDNMTTPGIYVMENAWSDSSPDGNNDYSLIVLAADDNLNFIQQIAIEESTGGATKMYSRTGYITGSWSSYVWGSWSIIPVITGTEFATPISVSTNSNRVQFAIGGTTWDIQWGIAHTQPGASSITVQFPVSFSGIPTVTVSNSNTNKSNLCSVKAEAGRFTIYTYQTGSTAVHRTSFESEAYIHWIAVGC